MMLRKISTTILFFMIVTTLCADQARKAKIQYLKTMSTHLKTVLKAYENDIRNAKVRNDSDLEERLKNEKSNFIDMYKRFQLELKTLAPLSSKHKALVALKPIKVRVGHYSLLKSQLPDGAPLFVAGSRCYEFLYAHASSKLIYQIPNGVTRFQARAAAPHSKSLTFEVLVDGKRKFKSKALSQYNHGFVDIDIKLSAASKQIELITDTMGDGTSDWSIWCTPRFLID